MPNPIPMSSNFAVAMLRQHQRIMSEVFNDKTAYVLEIRGYLLYINLMQTYHGTIAFAMLCEPYLLNVINPAYQNICKLTHLSSTVYNWTL